MMISFARVAPATAAMFKLTNADGGNEISLLPGVSGDLQFRIVTHAIDSFSIAEANMVLGAPYGQATQIMAIMHGAAAPWEYEEMNIPGPIGETGTFSYDPTESVGGYPLGSAEYIHDVFTLTQVEPSTESFDITFKSSHGVPMAYGPAPTYFPFTIAPSGFPPGFPNFLYVGDELSNNTGVTVNQGVPEPTAALLLIAGLAGMVSGLRSRRRSCPVGCGAL
jgi:hypothetical protein